MLPEYLEYWGLSRSPFSLTPDPKMLFMSRQHQDCLMRLKFAILSNKGGALLISVDAGAGKTSLLTMLLEELRAGEIGDYRTVFIDHPTLTVEQVIGEIARQLELEKIYDDKLQNLNQIRTGLLELYKAGTRCVLVIDEGQMLAHRPDILQELRILLNLCVSDAFLLTFIFSGQKPLETAVRKMPEFWQRLPVRFFLGNLDLSDSTALIRHRLRKAGLADDRELFIAEGYEGVYRFSQGCPRVICSVADLALVIGHSMRSSRLGFVEVSNACADMTSSGDSFHYFEFLKAADTKARDAGAPAKTEPREPVAKAVSAAKSPRPPGRQVICPVCRKSNPLEARTCGGCQSPLMVLCLGCLQYNVASEANCPKCGTEISSGAGKETRGAAVPDKKVSEGDSQFSTRLKRLGLERRKSATRAFRRGYRTSDHEELLFAIPRKGLFSLSARVVMKEDGVARPVKSKCGFGVSNEALILLLKDKVIRLPMEGIRELGLERPKEKGTGPLAKLSTERSEYFISFPMMSGAKTRSLVGLIRSYIQSQGGHPA